MRIGLKSPPPPSVICLVAGIFPILFVRSGGGRLGSDDASENATSNVTCIAHDTKYTCDCRNANEPLMLPHLHGYVFHVEVQNCNSLSVNSNSLEQMHGLRTITFKNITNLILNQNALTFSLLASNTPLIIEFRKVNFEIIDSHAINGNIEEISFVEGRIQMIRPFAFATLNERALLLKMDRMIVERIDPQAFKKFSIQQIEITNCIFRSSLPSKTFYDLEIINSLLILNVTFAKVHSKAFIVKDISKLTIMNNTFDGIDSEWIDANVRESVLFKGNYFGLTSPIAFKGISVHRDYKSSERLEMRFTNNTVRFLYDPRALQFNEDFLLNLHQLQYENYFSCKDLDDTTTTSNKKKNKPKVLFFQIFSEEISFQRAGANNQSLILSKIIELDCTTNSYLFYILIIVFGFILIVIAIAAYFSYRLAKKRKKRKMDIVLPEPRTYKETQIVYQIENAGLLKTDL